MDACAGVRDILEAAAVERDGVERLEAGDTQEAARVAGHLAACPPCADELVRLRRTAAVLRWALAEGPAPELRERTLALVRSAGVDRGRSEPAARPGGDAPAEPATPSAARRGRRASGSAWLVAAAAVLVVGAFGAGFMAGGPASPAPGPLAVSELALARLTGTHARIMDAADAVEVVLRDPSGVPRGMLAVAPSSGEMVAVAGGLQAAPAGTTYRCWIETGTGRTVLGTMYLAGDVGWWVGPVTIAGPVVRGTRFGVSLASPGGDAVEPVLVGSY
ncbi:MAG: anti-sigma factor [Chloroflexi bacterium]|nr:anti-sigma factor [Chloroflexota bacterium]